MTIPRPSPPPPLPSPAPHLDTSQPDRGGGWANMGRVVQRAPNARILRSAHSQFQGLFRMVYRSPPQWGETALGHLACPWPSRPAKARRHLPWHWPRILAARAHGSILMRGSWLALNFPTRTAGASDGVGYVPRHRVAAIWCDLVCREHIVDPTHAPLQPCLPQMG